MIPNWDDPHLNQNTQPERIETGCGSVEYAAVGAGPVVIALHGAMGGYDQSLILAQTVGPQNCRYLAVSRPGYLGTPISAENASPAGQADLLRALLDTLEIETATVLAISGGGPAALEFAIRHPNHCAGLVLLSTVSGPNTSPIPLSFKIRKNLARIPWLVEKMAAKAVADLERVAARAVQDAQQLERLKQDEKTWPLFTEMLQSTFRRMNERLKGTDNDIAISHRDSFALESISCPVLVVHGDADSVADPGHAAEFGRRLKNAQLHLIKDGPHVAIFTHRGQVQELVATFLQKAD